MLIFAAILFFLLVIAIKVSIFVFVAPILIGLFFIVVGNFTFMCKHDKFAPIWWNIVTGLVTVLSTSMLWSDILDNAIDFGAAPFIIFVVYGIFSIFIFAISMAVKDKKK